MTPEAALFTLLSGAGMPVYADASVPDGASMPYMTFELTVSGGWDAGEVNVPVRLWHRTTSEAVMNSMVRDLSRSVPEGGVTVPCDGGMIWVKRGVPWAQAISGESDTGVRSRYVNLDVEYLTTD